MGIISDLKDELTALSTVKAPWDRYHRNIASWVLPQTESYTSMVNTGSGDSIMAVTGTPVAAERSKHIYDMTSLWAIDRLTAGLLSLKTPESDYWQDLTIENDFGYVPNHEEVEALERVRDYLFRVRGNPMSGFWGSHKMGVKSMCAFGDGWQFVEELNGSRTPFRYEFMPLPELYPGVGPDGRPNRMGRVFSWTAEQIMKKWGEDKVGGKVKELANDPAKRHNRLRVLHMVRPRSDEYRNRTGLRGAQFASWYCLPDEDHLIGEGGFWEFPFVRYAWSDYGQKAFCEGPVALCIAEILSLQEMAKNELIASQQMLRPAIATQGKNFMRINFNPGATNPGLINGAGQALFAPITGGARPDFAQAVMESRRGAVREMLYLPLWQILVADQQSPEETATKSMIRAQEKGEMLGPVGISLNSGLTQLNDRELGILDRKNAFLPGSPLALPESILGANVAPQFTSPLDRLRRSGQVVGVRHVLEFLPVLEPVSPGISARIDGDEILELVQDVSGAPARILKGRDASKAAREANVQQGALAQTVTAGAAAGDAMKSLGEGGVAAAQGAEAAQASPALQELMKRAASAGRPARAA